MTEPLPCPFCGNAPALHPKNPEREGNAWGAVRCEDTFCPTFNETRGHGVSVWDGEDVSDDRGTAAYIECAVKRWNKRYDKP